MMCTRRRAKKIQDAPVRALRSFLGVRSMSSEGNFEPAPGQSQADGAYPADFGLSRYRSSRMLETYLGDIEYLIREQLWEQAAPLVLALPHICVALADSGLGSSSERYVQWCEAWVAQDEAQPGAAARAEKFRAWCAQSGCSELDASGGVPVEALRRLRLRRLSRAAPPRRRISPGELQAVGAEPEQEACLALLDAVRRWYADSAALDSTVQNNLARLAVLR
jgi:hypothetical protein